MAVLGAVEVDAVPSGAVGGKSESRLTCGLEHDLLLITVDVQRRGSVRRDEESDGVAFGRGDEFRPGDEALTADRWMVGSGLRRARRQPRRGGPQGDVKTSEKQHGDPWRNRPRAVSPGFLAQNPQTRSNARPPIPSPT